jgi:hypothetical protein
MKYGKTFLGYLAANALASVIIYGRTVAHSALLDGKVGFVQMLRLFVDHLPNVVVPFIGAIALTWFPCLLLAFLPKRVLSNVVFSALTGAVFGLLAIAVAKHIAVRFTFYTDAPMPAANNLRYVRQSEIWFITAGALSGLLFWFISVREKNNRNCS